MENLIFSLNATIPIFLMMLLGMLFRKLGWMDEVFAAKMNKFVFLVPLPVLLFEQLATVDFSEVWDIKFILFCFVVTAISITISTLISLLWKDRSIKGEFIQATYRSSAALLGIAFIQNIYGTAYGLDLWQHDFGDSSLENYVKNITMQELAQVVCLDQLAKEKEMELSEEENGKIAQAAEEYFASLTEDETAYMGVSESDIKEYYEHYALAQKVYHSLTKAVNEEVSDDEARVMEIMQIFISDESRANEIASRLAQGEDFATLANNYNELSSIQVNVSRDELPDAVEQIAFQMENDEVSGKITVDGGFYFIKCLNKYNQELTEANKANIVDKREKEAFDDEYNEFVSSLNSNINENLWENLELETGSGMKTDTFFEVFNTYCGDM